MNNESINKLILIQENIKKLNIKNDNSTQVICVSKTFPLSKISPLIKGKDLNKFQIGTILKSTNKILKKAIRSGGSSINDIDKLIQRDLDKYVDMQIRDDINKSKENVLFWGYTYAYIKKGSLTKKNQLSISNKFGEQKKDKLIKMIENRSSKDVINDVYDKLLSAVNNFRKIAPNKAKKEINMIFIKIEDETSHKGFFDEINRDI